MQLEPATRNDLIELIAANFKTAEVNELGRLVLGCFDSNEVAGKRNHISLSAHKCAGLLVNECDRGGQIESLIKLVVELDESSVQGRCVQVEGLEEFLGRLVRAGLHYDFKTGAVVPLRSDPHDLPNWGCLKGGREYDITIASIDIVGNSEKTRRLGVKRTEKMVYTLWNFVREKLQAVDGRIWSWAGDGGIIAFTMKDHPARAVRFAIEVQSTVPVFNIATSGSPSSDVALRIGIDTGRMKFAIDTGTIVSDIINYAAHLEKMSTRPGTISVSRAVVEELPPRMASIFRFGGIFEEKDYFRTLRRLDSLLCEDPEDDQERFA